MFRVSRYMTHNKKGFTFIELLVAVSIVALVATIGVYSIGYLRAKVRDAKRVAGIQELVKGFALYQNTVGSFPVNVGVCLTGADAVSTALTGQALVTRMPVDPLYSVAPNCFFYQSTNGGSYSLRYYLEVNSTSGTQGLHTETH